MDLEDLKQNVQTAVTEVQRPRGGCTVKVLDAERGEQCGWSRGKGEPDHSRGDGLKVVPRAIGSHGKVCSWEGLDRQQDFSEAPWGSWVDWSGMEEAGGCPSKRPRQTGALGHNRPGN